jgi:hypothetical protein
MLLPSLSAWPDELWAGRFEKDVFMSLKADDGASRKPKSGKYVAREGLSVKPDAPATNTPTVQLTI